MRSLIPFVLAVTAFGFAQMSPNEPKPIPQAKNAPVPEYNLTELQKARLDSARQKVWRWQDKMQEALNEFGALCMEAQKQNRWPPVQCGLNDLAITPAPPPIITPPMDKSAEPKK